MLVPKHDLKHFSKNDIFGFTGAAFMDLKCVFNDSEMLFYEFEMFVYDFEKMFNDFEMFFISCLMI